MRVMTAYFQLMWQVGCFLKAAHRRIHKIFMIAIDNTYLVAGISLTCHSVLRILPP